MSESCKDIGGQTATWKVEEAVLDGESACIDGEGQGDLQGFTVPQLTPFVAPEQSSTLVRFS